jgi:hypothetical protein
MVALVPPALTATLDITGGVVLAGVVTVVAFEGELTLPAASNAVTVYV